MAVLTFLQVWGFDGWLLLTEEGPGQRLMLILVVVGVSYLLWLGINHLIASYIQKLDAQVGTARSQHAHAHRARPRAQRRLRRAAA